MTGPTIGALFAGYGGLELAVHDRIGGRVVWYAENAAAPAAVMAAHHPDAPNLGDVTTVDWSAVPPVDVLTGGTPCQDVSHAGRRGGFTEGTRSNLWVAMREAIAVLQPGVVVWENVRGALSAEADSELESREGRVGIAGDGPVLRALGRVVGDLASLGYVGGWAGVRASDVGAPHGRFRVFLTAWPAGNPDVAGLEGRRPGGRGGAQWAPRPAGMGAAAHAGGEAVQLRPRLRADGPGEFRWGRPDDSGASVSAADTDGTGLEACGGRPGARHPRRREPLVSGSQAWGPYAPAIRRWEQVIGRPAPAPTELSPKGTHRLSAQAVEWMMGLPDGWVTDVPGLTRNDQLKALGNGVVPQQAAHALRLLLADMPAAEGAA